MGGSVAEHRPGMSETVGSMLSSACWVRSWPSTAVRIASNSMTHDRGPYEGVLRGLGGGYEIVWGRLS